jgi:hypothetical protein
MSRIFWGLLLESFIPEELYEFVELFHGRAVELLSINLATEFAIGIEEDGVLGLCENLEISLDESDVFLHLYYLFPLIVL